MLNEKEMPIEDLVGQRLELNLKEKSSRKWWALSALGLFILSIGVFVMMTYIYTLIILVLSTK